MRGIRIAPPVLLFVVLDACAPPRAPAPAEAPVVRDTSTSSTNDSNVVPAPPPPIEDPACEDDVKIPTVRSIIVIPAPLMQRALKPIIAASCACSRSGDSVFVTAVIVPEDGVVTAVHSQESSDLRSKQGMDLHGMQMDRCMQTVLARQPARFEPFVLESDCIDCGPKRYGIFRGTAPQPLKPAPSKIVYPLRFTHR